MPRFSIVHILIFFILFTIILSQELPFLPCKLITEPLVGVVIIAGLLFGITIHEFSHAFVAYRLGDPTAKLEGRLTLNPQAHLDPLGTALIFFIGFGWGKPTPFDPFNLRNIKRDSALISASGAISNFLFATVLAIPYLVAFYTQQLNPLINNIYYYLSGAIFFNLLLAIFNLIPLHPLDGFKVLAGMLPKNWYEDFIQTERFGILILLMLFATGYLGRIIFPIISVAFTFLLPGFYSPLGCHLSL